MLLMFLAITVWEGTISGDFETIICLYIPRQINSKNKNNRKTTTTTLTVFSNHNLVVVLVWLLSDSYMNITR